MQQHGAVAQLGERLICIQEVRGSIPLCSISWNRAEEAEKEGVLVFEKEVG